MLLTELKQLTDLKCFNRIKPFELKYLEILDFWKQVSLSNTGKANKYIKIEKSTLMLYSRVNEFSIIKSKSLPFSKNITFPSVFIIRGYYNYNTLR